MQVKQVFSTDSRKEDGNLGRFEYCPFCGTQLALIEKGGKPRPVCPSCGFVQFRNPLPGVVVVIDKEGTVLLGKRGGGFGEGKAIVLLARVVGGELRAADDPEAVEWFPLSGPLPEMAFEADTHICERYYRTQLEGAPVDPGYAAREQWVGRKGKAR